MTGEDGEEKSGEHQKLLLTWLFAIRCLPLLSILGHASPGQGFPDCGSICLVLTCQLVMIDQATIVGAKNC